MLSEAERDILLPVNPEPCVECDFGMAYLYCRAIDGQPRCQDCVHKVAARRGWDQPPVGEPPAPTPTKRAAKEQSQQPDHVPTLFDHG